MSTSEFLSSDQVTVLHDFLGRDDISSDAALLEFAQKTKLREDTARALMAQFIALDEMDGGRMQRKTRLREQLLASPSVPIPPVPTAPVRGAKRRQTPAAKAQARRFGRSESVVSDSTTTSSSPKRPRLAGYEEGTYREPRAGLFSPPSSAAPSVTYRLDTGNIDPISSTFDAPPLQFPDSETDLLNQKILSLSLELEKVTDDREKLRQETAKQKSRLTELEQSLAAADRTITNTNQKWIQSHQKAVDLEKKLEPMERDLESTRQKLTETKSVLQKAREEVQELSSGFEKKLEEVKRAGKEAIEKQLEMLEERHRIREAKIVQEAHEEARTLSDKLKPLEEELTSTKGKLDKANRLLTEARNEVKAKRDEIRTMSENYEKRLSDGHQRLVEERKFRLEQARSHEEKEKALTGEFEVKKAEALKAERDLLKLVHERRVEEAVKVALETEKKVMLKKAMEEVKKGMDDGRATLTKAEKEAEFKRGSDAATTRLEAVHNLRVSELRKGEHERIAAAVKEKEEELKGEIATLQSKWSEKEKELQSGSGDRIVALETSLAEAEAKVAGLSGDLLRYKAFIEKNRLKIRQRALRAARPSKGPRRPIGKREPVNVTTYTAQIMLGPEYREPVYDKAGRLIDPGNTEWHLPPKRTRSRRSKGYYKV